MSDPVGFFATALHAAWGRPRLVLFKSGGLVEKLMRMPHKSGFPDMPLGFKVCLDMLIDPANR